MIVVEGWGVARQYAFLGIVFYVIDDVELKAVRTDVSQLDGFNISTGDVGVANRCVRCGGL